MPASFRDVLSSFPAGVVVVTAAHPGGAPAGLTVSAFCSVSAEPPLVLVCVDLESNTLPAIRGAGGFTVNVLAAGSEPLALHFASKAEDKFAAIEWQPGPSPGGPILARHSVAHLVCAVEREVPGGDHAVFIGRVLEMDLVEDRHSLVYHRRVFSAVGGLG
jgi:flavin reductase (DIM6/NTAB) family NADH-FMN oxidoreductase RutF